MAMLGLVALFWLYAGWVQRGISLLVALEVIRCQVTTDASATLS